MKESEVKKKQQGKKVVKTPLSITDAITQAVKASKTKFAATVEAHFNFNLDVTKADQTIRTTTVLPNGTGKTVKIAVFASKSVPEADLELSEDDLPKIISGAIKPHVDFDFLVSEPRYMPKLATVARTLGPAGVMPNPKNGTVSDNPAEAVKKLRQGQVELKNEQNQAVIHTVIGKTSFTQEQLEENFAEVLSALKQNKPVKAKPGWIKSCFITTTMGPSFSVNLLEL